MTGMIPQSQDQFAKLLAPTKVQWLRRQLGIWVKHNLRYYPWRHTSDPYAIFIAEFMLQKTDADTVVPIYQTFLTRYPTLKDVAAAKVEHLAQILKPLGLFFRAKRLLQSTQILIERYDGKIPASEKQLLALPGVGIYTARAICSNAFNQPLAILDTNVARILERFFGVQGNRVKSRCKLLWKAAEFIAPKRKVGMWNLTLLDFGALVCTARKPHCAKCPLQKQCHYANAIAS